MNFKEGTIVEGPGDNQEPIFSAEKIEEYKALLSNKDIDDLKKEKEELEGLLEEDAKNQERKKVATLQRFPADELLAKVKYVEKFHDMHKQQLLIVEEKVKEKEEERKGKKKKGSIFGSLF
jgi:hypothetical protein